MVEFGSDEITKPVVKGEPFEKLQRKVADEFAIPLYVHGDRLIGCLQRAHENDSSLAPDVLLENLSAKASLGHSLKNILAGKIENTLFLAKGSLFLGRMTQLSDGISFLLEKNTGQRK